MLITISLLILAYMIMGKDIKPLLERVKNVDWRGMVNAVMKTAIVYTILPVDLLPRAVYKLLGVLDDGIAMLYVYKKIKNLITPEINAKVEETLNEWFGVESQVAMG